MNKQKINVTCAGCDVLLRKRKGKKKMIKNVTEANHFSLALKRKIDVDDIWTMTLILTSRAPLLPTMNQSALRIHRLKLNSNRIIKPLMLNALNFIFSGLLRLINIVASVLLRRIWLRFRKMHEYSLICRKIYTYHREIDAVEFISSRIVFSKKISNFWRYILIQRVSLHWSYLK